jgi:hypothetical protein
MKGEIMKKSLAYLLFLGTMFASNNHLYAQFTCTGQACSYLPSNLTNSLNTSYTRLQTEYLNEVLKTNTEAGFLANIGTSNIGTGTVRKIQIGASMSASGYKKDDVVIEEPGFKLPKLPNVGGSVIPNVNLDFNPGWVLGFESRHWMSRFGVFLHGMDMVVSNKQLQGLSNNKNYEGRITAKSYGGMLRYQLVEKEGFLMNLFTWNGINIGAGHHVMEENFHFKYLEGKAASIESGGFTAKWGGDTNFLYNTKVRTTNVDFRTGVGLFWIANVIVGGGYSWNSGDSQMSIGRSGPLLIQANNVSTIEIPREYQSQIDPALLAASPSGTLGLNLSGNAHIKRNMGYGIAGLELDIYVLKVIVEGLYGGKDLYSANVGVKLSL